jgi:hypothetical protein
MPATIAIMLAASPILALSLLFDLSPDAIAVIRLSLLVFLFVAVIWLLRELVGGLRERWSRFNSRPYC